MALNVLVIGGSRNIGYYSALRFLGMSFHSVYRNCLATTIFPNPFFLFCNLDAGSTVTFLLRSPTIFEEDESIQNHVKSGKARLIKGDGLVLADVQNVWAAASKDRPVDLLIFTVGFSEYPII